MIWTFLTFVSMVILGGFISYYGDLQGRRWGKRRVSWFGMRPKHTAIFITSLTGGFIALFGAVTLLLISPPVRDVVLRGERAIQENKRLSQQYNAKLTSYEKLRRDSESKAEIAQANRRNAETDLNQIRKELDQNRRDLAVSQKQMEDILRKNKGMQIDFYATQRNLKRETEKVAGLQSQERKLNQVVKSEQFTNHELGKQNLGMMSQQTKIQNENKNLLAGNLLLQKTKHDLEASNAGLEHAKEALLEANKTLIEANATTEQTNMEKARQLEAKIRDLTLRQEQLLGLLDNADGLASRYAALRQRAVVLHTGEPLARRIIDAHTRPEAIKTALQEVLHDASALAFLRGAGRGENGSAALLYNPGNIALVGSQSADEQQTLANMAEHFMGASTPLLITAQTLTNTIQGEQALIGFEAQPIVRTFEKNDLVASSPTIDAGKPVRTIIEAITRFLQTDVREAAMKRGTVPQINPQTGASEIGAFDLADMVELTDKIKRRGGKVKVMARAVQTSSSADPLRLRFEVVSAAEKL